MQFGDVLRSLLAQNQITQKQLAKSLNIAPSTLGNYIQNSREPDFEMLKEIAAYFGVSVDYLLDYHPAKSAAREEGLVQIYHSLSPTLQTLYLEQGRLLAQLHQEHKV